MSGSRKTESFQSIKTRQFVYQNPDGSFPPARSYLATADSTGHTEWTQSIDISSAHFDNLGVTNLDASNGHFTKIVVDTSGSFGSVSVGGAVSVGGSIGVSGAVSVGGSIGVSGSVAAPTAYLNTLYLNDASGGAPGAIKFTDVSGLLVNGVPIVPPKIRFFSVLNQDISAGTVIPLVWPTGWPDSSGQITSAWTCSVVGSIYNIYSEAIAFQQLGALCFIDASSGRWNLQILMSDAALPLGGPAVGRITVQIMAMPIVITDDKRPTYPDVSFVLSGTLHWMGPGTPPITSQSIMDLSCNGIQLTVSQPADTNAPGVFNGSPSGTLATGTTQATLSVNTTENATCR